MTAIELVRQRGISTGWVQFNNINELGENGQGRVTAPLDYIYEPSMEEGKRLWNIKAAQQVLNKNSDMTFLCVGAGDDSSYRKLVKPEFSNKIRFLGLQQNVESIMNICDIGVLMTNPDFHGEGISNAIMEFMTLGKPLIATDGGGTGELINDDETGFLVKPKSTEELASKIEYLLDNNKLASSMGEKGKERVKKEFSMEKMVNSFVGLYETIED